MTAYPSISIITCLYNPDLKIWRKALKAISSQNYPKNRIEHLILDGGSSFDCLELTKRFKNTIITRTDLKDKALQRMKLGISKSSGEILLFLEPDNIIIGNNWLKDMVEPFIYLKDIIGTFSMHNTFEKNMPILTKYSSLIGVNDPLVLYLNKSEKMPLSVKNYNKGKILKNKKSFYVVEFNENNLPTLGDNGHMVRAQAIKVIIAKKVEYYHPDAFMELLRVGANKYGVVKNKIIHYTGSDFHHFFSKRVLYKKNNYDNNSKRSYLVFNPNSRTDVIHLLLFIFYTLTLIQPIAYSIFNYLNYRDKSWFIHPIACMLTLVYYSKSQFIYAIKYRKLF